MKFTLLENLFYNLEGYELFANTNLNLRGRIIRLYNLRTIFVVFSSFFIFPPLSHTVFKSQAASLESNKKKAPFFIISVMYKWNILKAREEIINNFDFVITQPLLFIFTLLAIGNEIRCVPSRVDIFTSKVWSKWKSFVT